MQHITRDEVKKLVDNHENAVIVEALPEKEFNKGHIPGAVAMPVEKIDELAPQLLKDKDQKIITYCANTKCPASTQAAEQLENLGYTDVSDYKEGKEDWKQAGYPLEGEMSPP